MKEIEFEDYLDNRLDAAECSCSPKGLPHGEKCFNRPYRQVPYEYLVQDEIDKFLEEHRLFLEEELANEEFWNKLMKEIVFAYQVSTGNPWVSGSKEVRGWISKTYGANYDALES